MAILPRLFLLSCLICLQFGVLHKGVIAQNTCAAPVNIGTNPTSYASGATTTCGTVNDYGNAASGYRFCGTYWGNAEDHVYRITVSGGAKDYRFRLDANGSGGAFPSGTWAVLAIFSACPSPTSVPTNCYVAPMGGTSTGIVDQTINLANGTYYVIVDQWANNTCFAHQLRVDLVVPPPAGTNCSYPYTLAVPTGTNWTSYSGTTCGFTNALNTSCGTGAGEDFVFAYTVTDAPVSYKMVLTTPSAGGMSISVSNVNSCPSAATSQSTTGGCISPYIGGSGSGTDPRNPSGVVNFPTNGTYYIVIDRWSGSGCSTFDFRMRRHNATTAAAEVNTCPRDITSNTDNDDCYNARQIYLSQAVTG